MGAQLSRIGPGRSTLVVLVCAVLSLVGLVRSGLAGESNGNADSRDPVVLAPPKVKDPDLGTVERARASKSAKKTAAKAERTKTCVTALGQELRVPRSFKCPKVRQLSTPNAKELRNSGKVVPQTQTGGSQAPTTQQPATQKKPAAKPKQTTTQQRPVSGGPPSKAPNPGGVPAAD